jgi:hypothetical protein
LGPKADTGERRECAKNSHSQIAQAVALATECLQKGNALRNTTQTESRRGLISSRSCFDSKHNRRGDNEEQPLSGVICLRAFVDQTASFFGSATRNNRGVLLNPDPAGAESSERVSATFVLSR